MNEHATANINACIVTGAVVVEVMAVVVGRNIVTCAV